MERARLRPATVPPAAVHPAALPPSAVLPGPGRWAEGGRPQRSGSPGPGAPARRLGRRGRQAAALALCLAGAASLSSCGGGGGAGGPSGMALVDFVFLDRALRPTAPTGSLDLPRNAQLQFRFSDEVDPASVTVQTLRLRHGPQQADVGEARVLVSGSRVLLDPIQTANGQPHPFGLEPVTQYRLEVPAAPADGTFVPTITNLAGDPNTVPFRSSFITSDGWLFDATPPQCLGIVFEPDLDPATQFVPGNGRVGLRFSEVMDPGSFTLGPPALPLTAETTVDVRYDAAHVTNVEGGLAGASVAGTLTPDPAGSTWWFEPTFSFGERNYQFYVLLRSGVRDLAGNALINPSTFGPFLADGRGRAAGRILIEEFTTSDDQDAPRSDADWGGSAPGELRGQPITTREVRLYGHRFASGPVDSGVGQYAPLAAPFTGRALNQAVPGGVVPPTAAGRRVLLALSEAEMGERGTITACAWGPDSNATFASLHERVVLRMGHQADGSLNLASTFRGNYRGEAAVVYDGEYFIGQRANIGNVPGEPPRPHVGGYRENPGCVRGGTWNLPLFAFTGMQPFPALTTFFDWDSGEPGDDSVFLFDVAADEGDTWQQVRGWFSVAFPCQGGVPSMAQRRLFSTFDNDLPDPAPGAGAQNPEGSLYDVAFSVSRRITVATSRFYTPADASEVSRGGVTFGRRTDYLPAQLSPAVQALGTRVLIRYQGATLVDAGRADLNPGQPFTPWTTNVDLCDGYPCLRWRLELQGNLISNAVPRVDRVIVPMLPQ